MRGAGHPLADAVLAMLLQPRRALALRLVEGAALALLDGVAVEAQRQPPCDHRRRDRQQRRMAGLFPSRVIASPAP